MRAFACDHCGQLLFFEDSHYSRCGDAIEFALDTLTLRTFEPRFRDLHRLSSVHDVAHGVRRVEEFEWRSLATAAAA